MNSDRPPIPPPADILAGEAFKAESDFNISSDPAKAKVEEEERAKAAAIESFKERIEELQEEGVKYLSASGFVVVGDKVRKVWMGCPRHNPAREARRQAGRMADLFGWPTKNGKLSGRQWTKLRKRAERRARAEKRQKVETTEVKDAA